jgi:hypothetical protein
MAKEYFREEQRFNQWWIWVIILLACGIWIWMFFQQIVMGKPFGTNPASDLGVVLTGILPVVVLLLFRFLKLETIIDDEGVKCRFKPFQRKFKTFSSRDIVKFEVKKYNPILDYGGWGIRYGRKGSAYNVRGNMGLHLELRNKKNFLIGTQTPDSLKYAIEKLMKATES